MTNCDAGYTVGGKLARCAYLNHACADVRTYL